MAMLVQEFSNTFELLDPTSINQDLSTTSLYSLSVQPNPIQDRFTLSDSVPETSPIGFTLYDSNGRIVEKRTITDVSSGRDSFEWIPGKHFPPGLYFLTMQQAGRELISLKIMRSL